MPTKRNDRVIVYIDGFNLYFGIAATHPELKWLDVHKLSKLLLKKGQTLVGVNYFTARINHNESKMKRQSLYLDALKTTPVNIILGQYYSNLNNS